MIPTQFNPLRSSSLSNGLKFICNQIKGPFNAIGLLIRQGTSSENEHERGITYILSKLLTKHTKQKNEGQLFRCLEEHCATIVPNFSKDFSLLTVGFLPNHLQEMLFLLGEIVSDPLITQEDIDECSKIAEFELAQQQKIHPDQLVQDWTHFQAFGGDGLGNILPMFASYLKNIRPAQVTQYLEKMLACNKILLAGAGIPTEEFGKCAEKAFSFLPATSHSIPAIEQAVYQGGQISLPNHQPETNEFTRLALAFPSVPLTNQDAYSFAVANSLLGGGSSFSSGGPGKGMYSRLYTQVLNNYHWSESAQAFNLGYKTTGLFGIHGACTPGNAYKMLSVFYNQLSSLGNCSREELERAKNQLKSSIRMGLETRLVQVEDMARQLDALSKDTQNEIEIMSPEELCFKIDQVTCDNLTKVSQQIISPQTIPTVVLIQSKKENDELTSTTISSLHQKFAKKIQPSS